MYLVYSLLVLFLISSEVYVEENMKMYEPRSAYIYKMENSVQHEPESEPGDGVGRGVVSYCLQTHTIEGI